MSTICNNAELYLTEISLASPHPTCTTTHEYNNIRMGYIF